MKKKILIVSSSLSMGGLEKCLINFLDNINYDNYEVDLYLFNEGRALLEKLNKSVNLLDDSPYYACVYNYPIGKSIKTLISKKKFSLAFYRVGRFIRARFKNKRFTKSDWKHMQKTMLKIDKEYDVAIGFEEETACYYVADCVNAKIKLGWIHTDIKKINANRTLDEKAFSKLDKVLTVSNNSLNSLASLYPNLKDKFKVVPISRIVNDNELIALSNEPNDMLFEGNKILSVGRLVELKGFHLCVPALKKLIDDGYNVKWFVCGEGDFRKEIEEEIKRQGVENEFILLGNCANPYTFIKSSDICVQPSSYEGSSVAVFEEKYFQKPVVVTNIESNLELITSGVNCIIVERNEESIYQGVKMLLDNEELRNKIALNGIKGATGSKEIIDQIEELFN